MLGNVEKCDRNAGKCCYIVGKDWEVWRGEPTWSNVLAGGVDLSCALDRQVWAHLQDETVLSEQGSVRELTRMKLYLHSNIAHKRCGSRAVNNETIPYDNIGLGMQLGSSIR